MQNRYKEKHSPGPYKPLQHSLFKIIIMYLIMIQKFIIYKVRKY